MYFFLDVLIKLGRGTANYSWELLIALPCDSGIYVVQIEIHSVCVCVKPGGGSAVCEQVKFKRWSWGAAAERRPNDGLMSCESWDVPSRALSTY